MIEEKDIRNIYKGFYKIAEEFGDSKLTEYFIHELSLILVAKVSQRLVNKYFTSQRIPEKHRELSRLIKKIDVEEFEPLAELEFKQRKEEHKW